jgi:signal transduction histidine kinase
MTTGPLTAEPEYIQPWLAHRPAFVQALTEAFRQHAADNREELKSRERGAYVAAELFDLATSYLKEQVSPFDVGATASQLARQGLAMASGAHLMQTMLRVFSETLLPDSGDARAVAALWQKLNTFQIVFLENLAVMREVVQLRAQEESQIALQQALYAQLEQQRDLRQLVEKRSQSLDEILQLNARLARATTEQDLLDGAVSGICQALRLDYVTIYERVTPTAVWQARTTTAENPGLVSPNRQEAAHCLSQVTASESGEFIEQRHKTRQIVALTVAHHLPLDAERQAALVAYSSEASAHELEELPILLRTFGQGLSTLWRNLLLLLETTRRARELEILHGRYVDSIWQSEQASLTAQYDKTGLSLTRQMEPLPETAVTLPLTIGEQTFGHLALPPDLALDETDREFIETLVREMGAALNNAHLLQTTRAYSNQLQLAAEVSTVTTSMLERDSLMEAAVELIRARFDYYYVGLFLVDEMGETAVLQAGTGEAGRIQIERRRKLAVGSGSMVGSAIARNEARVAQNVALASDFAPNPYLPDTRAELALPLRNRGQVIGALSVQSISEGAFSQESITVLQNLADQLAAAITNADLFTQLQTTLRETGLLYEIGRQISEARNQGDVFNALIEFVRRSNLVDMAQIIVTDDPDYLTCPAVWSRDNAPLEPLGRYPRQQFLYERQLDRNEIVIVRHESPETMDAEFARLLMGAEQIKATALIPIFMETQWLGTLVLHSREGRSLNERSLQPFRALADQAAITLANQQLLRQTELLYQIGRSLSEALTRDDALLVAVQEIAQYTSALQCRIILYDRKAGVGTVAAAAFDRPGQETAVFPIGQDFVYDYLNRRRQPLLLCDTEPGIPAEALEQYVYPFEAQLSLLVPISGQQELIGFLALDSAGKRPFSLNHTILAQTVLEHLNTQIENLKLLDEALTSAQELIILNQIQSNLSSILRSDELASAVYREVGKIIDNAIFLLAQYDDETRQYAPLLAVIQNQPVAAPPRVLDPAEPLYAFLRSQHHLLTGQETGQEMPNAFPHDTNAQSGLWIPLMREDAPAGLICVQSLRPHAYRENDVQLLRSIATQTGLALQNARLFEQIQASVEQLRELDRMKNQFLANMSHELRTPLNSIIGFSRVILKGIDGPITTEQQEDLTSIYNNGQHLLMLINEILDMAKIEAGKMSLSFEQVDIRATAETVLKNIRSLLHADVTLSSEFAPDLPIIRADPIRIRQILINLLSNAAKFTTEGAINLTIERSGPEHILLTLADTGIGIAPEDYDKLFVAFEQVDNSTTRTAGGTGLGLPITKWLVTMHQGDLWFESELGKGTRFYVLLPVGQPAAGDGEIAGILGETAVIH